MGDELQHRLPGLTSSAFCIYTPFAFVFERLRLDSWVMVLFYYSTIVLRFEVPVGFLVDMHRTRGR